MPTITEIINKAKDTNTLKLSKRKLTSIPLELLDLINLQIAPNVEILNLKSNFIVELHTDLNGYNCLVTLILSKNHISTFPNLPGLSNLEKLYLDNNKFIEFPTSIYQLQNLSELYLQFNKIERFPTDIGELKNLKTLDLSNNCISVISTHLYNCKELEVLILSNNNICALPDGISALSNLMELNMENNDKLEVIPNDLGNCQNLSIFLCKNCPKMNTLPISLMDLEFERYSFDQTFILSEEHLSRGAAMVVKYLNYLQKLNLKFDSKAHWKLDEESSACFRCQSPFGFKLRRHHCRLCGEIFCHKCCTEKYSHPKLSFTAAKICLQCHQEIQTPIITEFIPSGAFHPPDRVAMSLQSSSPSSLSQSMNVSSQLTNGQKSQTRGGSSDDNHHHNNHHNYHRVESSPTLHRSMDVRKLQSHQSASPLAPEFKSSIHQSLEQQKDDLSPDTFRISLHEQFDLTEHELSLNFFMKKEIIDRKINEIEKMLLNERKQYERTHSPLTLLRLQEIGRMKDKLHNILLQMNEDLKTLLQIPPPPPPPIPPPSPSDHSPIHLLDHLPPSNPSNNSPSVPVTHQPLTPSNNPTPIVTHPHPINNSNNNDNNNQKNDNIENNKIEVKKFVPPPSIFTPAIIPSSIRLSSRGSFFDNRRPSSFSTPIKPQPIAPPPSQQTITISSNNKTDKESDHSDESESDNDSESDSEESEGEHNHSDDDGEKDEEENGDEDDGEDDISENSDLIEEKEMEENEEEEEEEEKEEEEEEKEEEEEEEEEGEEEVSEHSSDEEGVINQNNILNTKNNDDNDNNNDNNNTNERKNKETAALFRTDSLINHVKNQYPTAQVAFEFEASNDREISVPEGEFVNILKSDHSEWWLVMYKGKYGYLPRNYLLLDEDD